MIPILFDKEANKFTTNGLGALSEAISCVVTEQRNGIYELRMTYPQSGRLFSSIELQSIIVATPHDNADRQPFRIYKISKPINGKVTIDAQHISYQLSYIPVMPFQAANVQDCLSAITEHVAEDCPFSFWTDKSTVARYIQNTPASVRERLGGVQGSVLDVYGGEYEFDNYLVRLWNHRGADRGVSLRYGKNITDIKQEENIATTYTGVCPYWSDGTGAKLVTLPEEVIEGENADLFPYRLTKVVDMTTYFQNEPSVAELRAKTEQYVEENAIGIPSVSIDVDFVALWQTEEYKDIAVLQRVYLGDTINVVFEKLNIDVKARVVETQYDVLKERYSKIKVGSSTKSLADTIAQMQEQTNQQTEQMTTRMSIAIQSATDQITGQNGGYIVTRYDANNNPYEILIMDTPDILTAQKVWRWNNAGLGFSSTGYNGPYGTAITQDGKIVADFITAGTMSANRIHGGTLDLGGEDNTNGQIFIYDQNGNRCGQINNAGIAIYSPTTSGQVIINPDIGLVQRDSAGNVYYGLSVVVYPDIPTSALYKYRNYYNGVEDDELYITITGKREETIEPTAVKLHSFKYSYEWRHKNSYWKSTITKPTPTSTILVELPEIFRNKNISVTVTPEGIDSDKYAEDEYARGFIEYNTTLPKCKADGTTWSDSNWTEYTFVVGGEDYYVGQEFTDFSFNVAVLPKGQYYDTAKAYAGTPTSHLVVPDPSSYYVPISESNFGSFDKDNTSIVYTLDEGEGTISIDINALTTNGYSMNEVLSLRVVAIC